jgi:hypothetical protein
MKRSQLAPSRDRQRVTSLLFRAPKAKNPASGRRDLVSTADGFCSRRRFMAPRADVSERGGPGLPGARSRKATVEPARTNCRGVRGLSRAGRANDEDTAGLCAPADEPQFPLRPLQTSAQPFARQTETAAVTAVRPEFHRRIRYRENPISTRTCFADRYAEPPSMGRLISAATGRSCRR